MKGWKLIEPNSICEDEIIDSSLEQDMVKVKITKSMLTINDIHRFNGDIEIKSGTVLGSYGVGIVSEINANLFGIEKGDRVFIESKKPCDECYNCNSGSKDKCFSPLIAGEDYDGFLKDFDIVSMDNIYRLPDSVSETDALFINYISVAENIIDTLNIEKGNYVAIVGTNNFSIILAQLLIYYQAVPIMISENDKQKEISTQSGIYYTLTQNDNISKEVSQITGGRMADNVVYISDAELPVIKAFSIASYGANIAFTGFSNKSTSFSFNQALKKQLKIYCINDTAKNTPTCINILVNKAINVKYLNFSSIKNKEVDTTLKSESNKLKEDSNFNEIIVDMM